MKQRTRPWETSGPRHREFAGVFTAFRTQRTSRINPPAVSRLSRHGIGPSLVGPPKEGKGLCESAVDWGEKGERRRRRRRRWMESGSQKNNQSIRGGERAVPCRCQLRHRTCRGGEHPANHAYQRAHPRRRRRLCPNCAKPDPGGVSALLLERLRRSGAPPGSKRRTNSEGAESERVAPEQN